MPVAGGLVTMSRAQSANQEDHLADNVVKCVCTYCTHSDIQNTYAHKEQAKRKPKTTTRIKKTIRPTMLSNVSANKQAAHTAHTEIDVQSTGREETKTIWSTLSKEIMSASTSCSTRAHGLWTLWKNVQCCSLSVWALLMFYITGQFRPCGRRG